MMLKTITGLLLFLSLSAFSQDGGVDPRLLAYHGDKIIDLYENNREAYDGILYRLDNSFYIVNKEDFKGDQPLLDATTVKSNKGEAFSVQLLNDLKSFNYMLYDFRISQTEKTVYDLGDGRLMVFYSLNEVRENYARGVNTSNDEKKY